MPIRKTLELVEQDIQAGRLGKARDRLHGLIGTYPNALDLRKKLEEVYCQLQYREMAGRYWYLEADPSEEMID